jgi:hypothetical protein
MASLNNHFNYYLSHHPQKQHMNLAPRVLEKTSRTIKTPSPGFPSPHRYLNNNLCHWQASTPHLLVTLLRWRVPHHWSHLHMPSLTLEITLAMEPVLALVCTYFALTLIFTLLLVPYHQWHADVLTHTIGCHTHAKICTPPTCAYIILFSHSFSLYCVPPSMLEQWNPKRGLRQTSDSKRHQMALDSKTRRTTNNGMTLIYWERTL